MKYRSLSRRWFTNVALVILLILIIVAVALFLFIRSYYYDTARMKVEVMTQDEIHSVFNLYGASTSGFDLAARDYVEGYPDKNSIAVWGINRAGKVIVSSTGFAISSDVSMPDFDEAVSNDTGTALWMGRLPSGEKIMASTCTYRYNDGEIGGALRFLVSMDAIDKQLLNISALIVAVAVALYGALIFSGMMFIRSIVNPVKEIGETAKKIAVGDLNASIEHYPYNDEIGELCNTINDMADKLSESDKMKNDFISTVSHELRTPLTAISGWGETLLQIGDSDPATSKRGMEIIISESGRLNKMVEELLDFSRMNSGRMKLQSEKLDFLAELDETVFSFKERAIKEGKEFLYNVPKKPAPGVGDSSRIKQVFINILDNALKYTEQGGKINISAEIKDRSSLIVTVSDNGAGIKEEDLPHVKEKFYKANNTVRGSGIGLAICDEIIKLHGGTLDIQSTFGEGTTVVITLPVELPPKSNAEEVHNE